MERLIKDRGTEEIPPAIKARPDLYPHPEDYTYIVRNVNGHRVTSIFKKMSEEEIIKQENLFKAEVANLLIRHPDMIKEFCTKK